MFIQQLAATPTGHQHVLVAINAGEGNEFSAPGHCQIRDQRALSAESHAIRGVFHVTAGHNPAVINKRSRTDGELRVGSIGALHGINRSTLERHPIHAVVITL